MVYQGLTAIIVLGLLVFVHELGHFLLAKWHKVGVLEFALGFGPVLVNKKWGDTTYSIRAIPLGGFVRMVGEHPSLLHDETEAAELMKEMTPEEQRLHSNKDCWFLNKPYWPKFSIVFAGPLFNIIFAVFLAVFSVYHFGKPVPQDRPVIGDLLKGFPAEKAGLRPLDRIMEVNGEVLTDWRDLVRLVSQSEGKEMRLVIERPVFGDGQPGFVDNVAVRRLSEASSFERITVTMSASYQTNDLDTLMGDQKEKRRPRIGAGAYTERADATLLEALYIGTYHVWKITELNILGMYHMIVGNISAKNIGGPILIVQEAASSAKRGFDSILDFMILLSMSLAILNLLPIPVLDGGHIMFFTIEALCGGPVRLRIQQVATQVGMAILLALMLFAFSNDLLRLLGVYPS